MNRRSVLVLVAVLALAVAGCDWTQEGFGPSHQYFNGGETAFTTENVSELASAWSTSSVLGGRSPIAWGDHVAVTADAVGGNRVVVHAADGSGCTGTPVTCTPQWTSMVGRYGGIAVDGSTLFATAMADPTHAQLAAFDAEGAQGCSGTPTTCTPLWTATWSTTATSVGSPVIADGRVYIPSGGTTKVVDASGTTGCSTTAPTCAPLFELVGGGSWLSIRSGLAFSATATDVAVFDATGATCIGPCTPIRRLMTGPSPRFPALANGFVYIVSASGMEVFDERPESPCPGAPATCSPRWTTPLSGFSGGPVVTDTTVFLSNGGALLAFDAQGSTGCGGTPRTCTELWRGTVPGSTVKAPRLATASLLFVTVSTSPDITSVAAFDLEGVVGCSGAPTTCTPLWEGRRTSGTYVVGLIAANGRLVSTFVDFGLVTYELPD